MTTEQALHANLHATGRRLTPQRALVLKIIEENEGHLDAEAIWQQAVQREKTINLATVYRTLGVLKEMGLVEQRYFAREHKREIYESTRKPEHFHFTCLGCQAVVEFETNLLLQARNDLKKEIGAKISHTCVCFEGYCAGCAAKQRSED